MSGNDDIPHGLRSRLGKQGAASQAAVKFQIEGPWNIGDPVHESITNAALQSAGIIPPNTPFNAPAAWEFIRGVIWNDDPEGLLFDHNDTQTDNWSSGADFLGYFNSYKHSAKAGKSFGPDSPLLARSHFGDMQCLHAMASRDEEPPAETRAAILEWAEFFYRVAIGEIAETASVRKVEIGRISDWLRGSTHTIRSLLLINQKGNVRHRALGALLHIIEDSYAKGHVERNTAGATVEFHSYVHQDPSKHEHDDVIAPGGLKAMPGAQIAIHRCAEILVLLKNTTPWPAVRTHLETRVFPFAPDVRPASAGADYRI